MEYFQESLNRQSGELQKTSMGEWITITELAEEKGVGSRQVRSILVRMGFMFVHQGDGKTRSRTKICPWVVDRGWGRHLTPSNGYPFDVINGNARAWIAERWDQTKAEAEALGPELKVAKDACDTFFSRRKSEGLKTPEATSALRIRSFMLWRRL